VARDVFVSYSHPDHECAFAITARLEASGIGVWIAPRDIVPAGDWAEEIINAINGARVMVLVLSAHSNDSPQVRREVERAVHKNVPVLPFRIEQVEPSKSLEYFLSAQHWLDAFPPPVEPFLERLVSTVATLLAAAPAIPAPVTRPVTRPLTPARMPANFAAADLQSLERQLARHIGPLARLLVARAAARSSDWTHLTEQLAGEIDSPAARQQFVRTALSLVRPGA
jgi:hypothetical protein